MGSYRNCKSKVSGTRAPVSGYPVGVKVFISHAERDGTLARRLAEHLRAAGHEAWSADQVLPGENWAASASAALESSDAMVVLVSPEAAASPQVQREIEYALGSPRFADRVISVVVRRAAKMPWILKRFRVLRLRHDGELVGDRVLEALEHAGV